VLPRLDGGRSVFLYELGVDVSFRGRGLGRALVDEAVALTEREGALKMWVETSYGNEPARRTYEAAGGTPDDEPTIAYTWRSIG
jgi:ribosomal protein S18 acetylase RimI-like enzyme